MHRQHRRRPADRLGRRVQQLPRPVRPVRHGDGQPQPVAAACRTCSTRSRRAPAPTSSCRRIYSSDPARNGEPFGELGLVTQQDAAWGDQHGGPRDPQPGHEHNHRDIHRTTNVLPIGSGPDVTPTAVDPPGADPVILDPAITAASSRRSRRHRHRPDHLLGWGGRDPRIHDQRRRALGQRPDDDRRRRARRRSRVDLSTLTDGTLTVTATETDAFGNIETYPHRDADEGHDAAGRADARPLAAPTPARSATGSRAAAARRSSSTASLATVARVYVNGVLYTGGTLANGTLHGHRDPDRRRRQRLAATGHSLLISGASTLSATLSLNGGGTLTNESHRRGGARHHFDAGVVERPESRSARPSSTTVRWRARPRA